MKKFVAGLILGALAVNAAYLRGLLKFAKEYTKTDQSPRRYHR